MTGPASAFALRLSPRRLSSHPVGDHIKKGSKYVVGPSSRSCAFRCRTGLCRGFSSSNLCGCSAGHERWSRETRQCSLEAGMQARADRGFECGYRKSMCAPKWR